MAVDVGNGVKEMGWKEGGGKVSVIDNGVGGDTAGTNRSDSAVLKVNRAKWGKFKESNII